ncbi:hypothetical protein KJS94_07300 [Flavihumibacter rivuli]|uniref:hypothetical protein n=1 Tax=Flavihumibacter rivuli TaxID=2838156 RepID=UPI001BDE3975|nr:hypothetical protein [Flavihumibacter rivuli]ULQ58006.1 hypothetical protein KJS94_07300 [Flavihumibacter rivuli]
MKLASSCWVYIVVIFLGACGKDNEPGMEVFSAQPIAKEVPEGYAPEASGIVDSYINDGQLWLIQDGGNPAELLPLSHEGIPGPKLRIEGVVNRDWEEVFIGAGPMQGKPYLYIADIGDNFKEYGEYTILRFPEPLKDIGVVNTVEKIGFRYEDGRSRNANAILVDPKSLDILILTKEADKVDIYTIAYPQLSNAINQASFRGSLNLGSITAASLAPGGTGILLRNYKEAYYWNTTSSTPLIDALAVQPAVVSLVREPQGEAISFSSKGDGFFTLSEQGPASEKVRLMFYSRK